MKSSTEINFQRRLLPDHLKIESKCMKCGTVIVGSAMHGIQEMEEKHAAECYSPRGPQNSPESSGSGAY